MDADVDKSDHIPRTPAPPIADLEGAFGVFERLRARLRRAVRGRDEVIDLVIIALLADGHVLLEDYPGSGKTTLAKALGDAIVDDRPDGRDGGPESPPNPPGSRRDGGPESPPNPPPDIRAFRRIQFTPDLLPSDVTGTTVFDPTSGRFFFRAGPIFAHVVLADEINRTSPKVQSAMLEAMAEKQTTVDNRTRKLDPLFFVIATQNPLDVAGTYPLPEAQLDRFLFRVKMRHIDREAELEVLAGYKERRAGGGDLPRVTRTEILEARAVVEEQIVVAPALRECLVDVAGATRDHEQVVQGASTRSLVLMIPALQASALAARRAFVTSADVEALARHVFGHRLELVPGADPVDAVIAACMKAPLEALARATLRRP